MSDTLSIGAGLVTECDTLGIRLSLGGDGGLIIDAPRNALTPGLLERLKAYKGDVLDLIERFEERVAIMEFDGGLNRSEAERLARKECFTN